MLEEKTCTTCNSPMDVIGVYRNNHKEQEFYVCPKCHAPELKKFSDLLRWKPQIIIDRRTLEREEEGE